MSHIFRVRSLGLVLLMAAVVQVAGCGSPEERAQAHYERGMQLLAKNDYVKASIELKNALQLKKELVGAWRGLAQIEEHNGQWESVTSILHTITELDPKDVDAKLRLARLMVLANSLDEAMKLVDAATLIKANDPSAMAIKAAIQLKLNDPKGAVQAADSALKIDPANTEALIVLAAVRMSQNDFDGALKLLETAPPAQADQLGIQLFKMKLYERLGNQQQVEQVLRKLVGLYPKEASFRKQLVRYYVDQKRQDEAEKEIRAIAATSPEDLEAGLDVVRFLNTFKGGDAAKQELITRIGAGGDVFRYQMALADLYFTEGKVDDSTKLLDELIHNAGSADKVRQAQIRLAELQLSRKNLDATEALAATILAKDARNGSGLKLRASVLMERGKYDAATADLREALNDQPRSAELMQLLAVVYERSGAIELADRQYADALRAANFDPATGLNYVAFLRRRGSNDARAEDILTELLEHSPKNIALLSALAQVRLARQNWTGAQEVSDTLRTVSNDKSVADQIVAAALSGQKKYDESIGILQDAYAARPGSAQAMYALVNTLVRAQKSDRALTFVQTVLEKDPANADALVLLASLQLASNEPDKAAATLQTAIKSQPKNVAGYRALGQPLSAKGQYRRDPEGAERRSAGAARQLRT